MHSLSRGCALVVAVEVKGLRVNHPEGYQNADSSCGYRVILVDQAAEEIVPFDLRHDADRVGVTQLLRYPKLNPAVRSLGVVVPGVARENPVELAASEDQRPVEGFVTQCLHQTLGTRIGLG